MSNKPLLRFALLTFAILLGLAVLALSVLPVNRVAVGTRPRAGSSPALVERAAILHASVHIVLFGALACAAWFAFDFARAGAVNKLIALTVILLLGWGTEYLQHRLYDNAIEVHDVLINILSASSVFGLLSLWARYRKLPPEPRAEGEHVAYVLRDLD